MIKISCEGATSLEVLSHLKGFATLISAEVPAKTGMMPEDIVAHAGAGVVSPVGPTQTDAPTSNSFAAAQTIPQAPPVAQAASAAASAATAPVPTVTTAAPVIPVANAVPAAAPTAPSVVPVAPAPSYDLDQLSLAASRLVDAGKRQELVQLLGSFGVDSLPRLSPEQMGAFATALRGMGAQL